MFKFTSINILHNAVNFIHTAFYVKMSRKDIIKGTQLLVGLKYFLTALFTFIKAFILRLKVTL